MYIKFTKQHPSGIRKGTCSIASEENGERWIKEDFAEKITEGEYNKWVKSGKDVDTFVKPINPEEIREGRLKSLEGLDIDGLKDLIETSKWDVGEIKEDATREDIVTLIELVWDDELKKSKTHDLGAN